MQTTVASATDPSAIDAVRDTIEALSRLLECADRLPDELVRDAEGARHHLLTMPAAR
jgi:hypothetical protein